jgi:hypothetical protein
MSDLTTKTVVELAKLDKNNEYVRGYVQSEIKKAVASGLKTVSISGNVLSFYDVDEPVGETKAKYSIELPETDLSDINKALATIQGDENTEGSIKAIAKEYADSKDEAIAAAKKAGEDAQADVDALEELVGTIPEDATAKTIVDYAKEVTDKASGDASQVASDLASEVTRATGEEEALGKRIDGVNETIGTVTEGKTVVEMISEAQSAATYDDTTVKADIKANKDAIDLLNGDSTKEGSVDSKVATAVANIVADAPEAYDTLKEIADWISTHADSASAMNTQINANKNDIADLVKLIGTLPEGTDAETIVAYIDSKVAGVKDWADDITTAKNEAISTSEKYTDDAIAELDSIVSQAAGDDGLAIEVVEEDGKLKSVTASIAAKTYDSYGSASAVQSNLDDFIGSITFATDAQIAALWASDTTTE